jgi:hypothetical protein
MKTAYDWITVMIFAGLVTHFLHTSSKPGTPELSMWHYLVPCVGCAVANWLGNEGWDLAAIALIAATLVYIFYFFRPQRRPPQRP